jgi:hypothetical protein
MENLEQIVNELSVTPSEMNLGLTTSEGFTVSNNTIQASIGGTVPGNSISLSNNASKASIISGNSTSGGINFFYPVPANPVVQYSWWPTYWPVNYYEDKHSKAFKVVKVLMSKRVIKLTSINKFVELVDEIVRVL